MLDDATRVCADPTDMLLVSSAHSLPIGGTVAAAAPARLDLDFGRAWQSGKWALQLDKALGARRDPVLIVAQGLAGLAVAWWAQLSPKPYLRQVAGAIFIAPLSFSPAEAAVARTLRPSPGTKLPFPSIVSSGASAILQQVVELADIWGSRFVDAEGSDQAQRRALDGHPLRRYLGSLKQIGASIFPRPGDAAATDAPLGARD